MSHGFYMSLDEARSELHRRWNDAGLRSAVESALGQRFMEAFRNTPRAWAFRQLVSPDNGFMLFNYSAAYLGAVPLVAEYLGDRFTVLNEEKKGLVQPRVSVGADKFQFRLIDLQQWENRSLGDIVLDTGETLAGFCHALFNHLALPVEILDQTAWFRAIGNPVDYYYPLFAHAVAHGVLFETYLTEDEEGDRRRRKTSRQFADEVVRPNFERVTRDFGLRPMIVRSFPDNQTDAEDFYWWSYPPIINDYLVDYARRNQISLKKVG